MTIQIDPSKVQTATLASPEAHFEACLERAAIGLCQARGLDPTEMVLYNNGTLAYTTWPRQSAAKEELRDAWRVAMFVRSLP